MEFLKSHFLEDVVRVWEQKNKDHNFADAQIHL